MSGDMATKNPTGAPAPGMNPPGGIISPQDTGGLGNMSGASGTSGSSSISIKEPTSPDGVNTEEALRELYEKMKGDLQELMRMYPPQAPNGGQPTGGPQQDNNAEAQKLLDEASAKDKEAEGLEQPKEEALTAMTDASAQKGAAETKVTMTEGKLEDANASLESAKGELSQAQAMPDFITVTGPDGKPRRIPNPDKPPAVAKAQQKVNQAQEKVDKLKTELETAKQDLEEAKTKEKEAKEKHKGIEEKQKQLKAEAQQLREQAQEMQKNSGAGGGSGGGQPSQPFPDPSIFEGLKQKFKQYMEEILKKLGILPEASDKIQPFDFGSMGGNTSGNGANGNQGDNKILPMANGAATAGTQQSPIKQQ